MRAAPVNLFPFALSHRLNQSIVNLTALRCLTLISVLGTCCAQSQAQPQAQSPHTQAQTQIRIAQRNDFYVPKPSTTVPTAPPAAAAPRPAGARGPLKVLHTRLNGFNIPFKVNTDDQSFVEVHLYLSVNQGATWEFYGRQPTTATEFPFQAKGEGEYWFAIKTLDRNRRLLPAGDPQPELRIIVDTSPPKLEVTAAADPAGRIICRWNASDVHLQPKSLQLLYKPTFTGATPSADVSQWQPVTVNTPLYAPGGIYVDQLAFWPETNVQTLDVRVVIADQAGNSVNADRRIAVQAPSWRHSTRSTARPNDLPPIDPSRVPNAASNAPVRNMKCEDGRCAIPPVAAHVPQWKRAFYSKLQPRSPDNYRANQTTADRKAVPQAIFRPPPYSPQKKISPQQQQLSASQSTANQRTAMLVGSEPHFAAPPVPAGWTLNDGQQNARPVQPTIESQPRTPFPLFSQNPNQNFTPPQKDKTSLGSDSASSDVLESDVWESAVRRDATQSQTSVGSTMAPDHRMLPIPSGGFGDRRTDSISANPNTIKDSGDQWVSKSSTNFPRNQYRGLDSSGLPTGVDSELLPGTPQAAQNRVPNSFQTTGNTRPFGQMLNASYAPAENRESGFGPSDSRTSAARTADSRSSGFSNASQPTNIGRASTNGPSKTNTQIISTKRFRLNYDINAIDPSGVGKVDLYITQDQGRSWTLWGQDPDNQSPFPVEVQQQGLYGFRVVVHSKDGLVGTGPSSGDGADMWVRIDSQTPLAQITSVPYGRGNEAGRLVINYRVSDEFLTLRPIRISYSRSPEGPWTIIEDNLRNQGRYLWKVDRAVPDRIFLKIDAIDQAGNVGTHQLHQSVDVSGLVPRGTIHGVEPVGR